MVRHVVALSDVVSLSETGGQLVLRVRILVIEHALDHAFIGF